MSKNKYFCDLNSTKEKFYSLGMFPYPSGNAHMGHVFVYTIADIVARFNKLLGKEVLNPIGWDAFGLPAENAAISAGINPSVWTYSNIDRMRNEQFRDMDWSFDFTKEITTCDPLYYANTQRLFLLLYKMGLAYKKETFVNYDPVDKTVLADEQVINGKSWRSGAVVEKRLMNQWFFRISSYCERLWNDIEKLKNWPSSAIGVQKNWINKTEGFNVKFPFENSYIEIFTTRLETIFGVTAIVLAPEHLLVSSINDEKIKEYVKSAIKESNLDRASKSRTGINTGLFCTHPLTYKQIPIYVGSYVLPELGTGAIMCVPAHDKRDYDFAINNNLPIIEVIEDGKLKNSVEYNGAGEELAKIDIDKDLAAFNLSTRIVNYSLRDWSVGRQRFWGVPIPIIECKSCGVQPVPDEQLPVLLPKDNKELLSNNPSFYNTTCPNCGGYAKRETDTLDTFVCSSWYAFRFIDPNNKDKLFNSELVNKWLPINFYVGGIEHAAQHMIYFRFITKVLFDADLINFDEPVDEFFCNGMIKKDGAKMSKSLGNVIVPTEVTAKYGSDAVRLYIMSDTPASIDKNWVDSGLIHKKTFLDKIESSINGKSISFDRGLLKGHLADINIRAFYSCLNSYKNELTLRNFNVCVAKIHEMWSLLEQILKSDKEYTGLILHDFLTVISLFVPNLSNKFIKDVFNEAWPLVESEFMLVDKIKYVIQLNGKKKLIYEFNSAETKDTIIAKAFELVKTKIDTEVKKTIFVPNKIVNFLV